MERELLTSQSELAHLSRLNSLGAMASSLSHELNQPLTAIVNYIGAAKVLVERPSTGSTESILEALESAMASTLRAGAITRRLREMSLKRPILKREVALTELVNETVPLALETAAQTRAEAHLDIDPAAELVCSDPTLLQQVLFNLIRNASQAMSDTGGLITIRAKPYSSSEVLIEVADTGSGLPPEISKDLFTAFRTTKKDGMGIGLAVCRTIIESQGGRIWAESSPTGTAFCFTVGRSKKKVSRA